MPASRPWKLRFGAEATRDALREAADHTRRGLRDGDQSAAAEDLAAAIEAGAAARLGARFQGSLRRVINATGVIVHTNLGRAPLSPAAIARIADTAGGYTNLEYDLAQGTRGSRTVHAESLITALTGAEAAVVVNNNAAATLLMLAALATGREVIISRGELVEIGGGFRVPDIMAQSGAILREIGTTNRTACRRLHGGGNRPHRAHPARAPLELPDRRIHRAPHAARARRRGPLHRHSRRRGPRQRQPG